MFDSHPYPKPLDELEFEAWLENGRASKLSYRYLLIIWDELDEQYAPAYVEHQEEISRYEKFGESTGRESLVAIYDLYSESRMFV